MSSNGRRRLRQFILQAFDDEGLMNLCHDYFPQVYNEFTTGMLKGAKVRLLVDRAERSGRLDDLHAALKRENRQAYDNAFPEEEPLPAAPPPRRPIVRNQRRIFISHASADAEFAHWLAGKLRDNGWQMWIAPDSIRPGEKWGEAIDRGLQECGVFVLLVSAAAVNSNWVRRETFIAIDMETRGELRYIPMMLEMVTLPPTWRSNQWIAPELDAEAKLAKLLDGLEPRVQPVPELRGEETAVAPTPEMPDTAVESSTTDSDDQFVLESPASQRPEQPTSPKPSLIAQISEKLKALPRIAWAVGVGVVALVLLLIFWPDGGFGADEVTPTDAAVAQATSTAPLTPTATAEPPTATPTQTTTPTITLTPTATPDPNIPPADAALGDTWTRPKDGMVMVYVPPPDAPFVLESGVDAPTEGFWIDKYEVSNAQYQMCVDAGACEPSRYVDDDDFNGAEYPVVGVSAFDAEVYSAWVGAELPTEGQWEYAAVGDSGFVYPWGDEFDGTLLNFCDTNCEYSYREADVDDGYQWTAPVDSFPDGAGWVGALNMSGNVWEWTASWYDEDETRRVLRGGSWDDLRYSARATYRYLTSPDSRYYRAGFRVVVRRSPSHLDP